MSLGIPGPLLLPSDSTKVCGTALPSPQTHHSHPYLLLAGHGDQRRQSQVTYVVSVASTPFFALTTSSSGFFLMLVVPCGKRLNPTCILLKKLYYRDFPFS